MPDQLQVDERNPMEQAAYELGSKGAPTNHDERRLFEAWMRGHCWYIGPWVDTPKGGQYYEQSTRMLWAVWRDRAALPAKGEIDERNPNDLRAAGLMVAVHNDYRLNGEAHTFWLFTDKTGMSYKGEGGTDAEALNQVRSALQHSPAEAQQAKTEPIAYITKDDLADLEKHGVSTVYAVKQERQFGSQWEMHALFTEPTQEHINDAINMVGAEPQASPDPVVEANREMLLRRSLVGMKKYGVTLDKGGLSLQEFLQHALEESLDNANYLQAAIRSISHSEVKGEGQALTKIRAAINEYYAALDNRQHGGIAESAAFSAIQQIIGMHWAQGASKVAAQVEGSGS